MTAPTLARRLPPEPSRRVCAWPSRRAALLLILIAAAVPVGAQECSGFPWTVSASQVASGLAINICGSVGLACPPRNPRVEIQPGEIRVTLTQAVFPDCTCLAIPITFAEQVFIPSLPQGDYTVNVFNFYCTESTPAGSTNVTMGTPVAVPLLDTLGLAVLALAIGAVGFWRLQR